MNWSRFAKYKINVQKSIVFLYTCNKKIPKEIKILFIIVPKRIKHLKITEEGQDLYSKNYKTSFEETKNINNRKTSYIHGLENLILLTWQYSPNLSTDWIQPIWKPQMASLQKLIRWS